MTKPLDPSVASKVAAMVETLLAACDSPDESMRQRVQHASELAVLAAAYREQALSGGDVSISDMTKLEELAWASRNALGLPERKPGVSKIEVVFVDTPERTADLRAENERLQQAVDLLKAELRKAMGQADEPRVLSIPDAAISAPQRQLPAPEPPEEPMWDPNLQIIRGNQHPALDAYKRDWPVY
jgi:hypothetical protein